MSPDPRKPGTTREQLEQALAREVRHGHEAAEDSDPPSSAAGPYPPAVVQGVGSRPAVTYERHSDIPMTNLVKAIAKRLAPWVAVGSAIVAVVGYVFAAGRKTADFPTKADVAAVAAEDDAVHKTQESQLREQDKRLERITTILELQTKSIDEIKADVKELRHQPGMVVSTPARGTK